MKLPFENCVFKAYPEGSITQYFGENPALYTKMGLTAHNGTDLVAPHGTQMFAVEGGIVCDVKEDAGGYGKHIRIITEPKNGVCRVWTYGHCHTISAKLGELVFAGEPIATMGNTGFVVSDNTGNGYWKLNPFKGTHLHLGVREVKRSTKGWAYEGSNIKMTVLNADNGYKGAIDPLPLFGVETDAKKANLEAQVSILTKMVELYKQLKAKK